VLFDRFRRRGAAQDFARVYDATAPGLRALARRHVRLAEDVEDVVQTAFLRAFEARSAFDPQRRLVPWLCGILVHAASEVRRAAGPATVGDETLDQLLHDGDDPVAEAIDRELDRSMRCGIEALPSTYREIARLAAESLPPVAIAERLGRSPSTVRTQLARAVALLRRQLTG